MYILNVRTRTESASSKITSNHCVENESERERASTRAIKRKCVPFENGAGVYYNSKFVEGNGRFQLEGKVRSCEPIGEALSGQIHFVNGRWAVWPGKGWRDFSSERPLCVRIEKSEMHSELPRNHRPYLRSTFWMFVYCVMDEINNKLKGGRIYVQGV